MAWIESHQSIGNHPKVFKLARMMGWSRSDTVGRLHLFWHWCLDYATDGQLIKYNPGILADIFSVKDSECNELIQALHESEFLDFEPHFRVHDWWDYAGRYLQVRYKHKPKVWKEIKRLYGHSIQQTKQQTKTVVTTDKTTINQPTNLNQPNQPKPTVVVRTRDAKLGELEALSLTEELQSWAQREFGVRIPEDVLLEFKAYWREQPKLRTDWIATLKSRVRQIVARGILKPTQADWRRDFLAKEVRVP